MPQYSVAKQRRLKTRVGRERSDALGGGYAETGDILGGERRGVRRGERRGERRGVKRWVER